MKLSDIGEDALVDRLTRRLRMAGRVVVGPGDDCAVIRVKGREELQLLKTDCVVEDVHFLRDQPPDRVGWKALCRALSDIAACGGRPDAAMVTVALPEGLAVDWVERFYRGLVRAARRFQTSIVGGETARSPGGIFVSVALTGWVKPGRLALRSGGKPGDNLFVTGRLGGSLRNRHLSFTPRIEEARWLVKRFPIHAMMDLSDGLGADLPRLADASGRGFEVDMEAIPRCRGCTTAQAVGDGEDYELLFAVPASAADTLVTAWAKKFPRTPLTRIGRLVRPRRSRTGLPAGFAHFSGCPDDGNSG